jgi:ERF superfamily
MQQSSETIGAIAAALARAQVTLTNPEKAQTAIIHSPFPREENRAFRYASLASGLDIVRKALGQQEIATIQSTRIEPETGRIHLTTTLAHSSGEWITSDWPVVAGAEMDAPHRMGTALTYARRYSLFALVGIAGEDDLDAPDLIRGTAQPPLNSAARKVGKGLVQRSTLNAEESDALREQLLGEISAVKTEDELLKWAQDGLKKKNTLIEADARAIEIAYRERLDGIAGHTLFAPGAIASGPAGEQTDPQPAELAIPKEPMRRRNKTHLLFVRGQPCLVCKRSPCDAHHIKFAQSRALGRKVSDEFTVPLCRSHHHDLHRHGNEKSWWANLQTEPLEVAKELWRRSSIHELPT